MFNSDNLEKFINKNLSEKEIKIGDKISEILSGGYLGIYDFESGRILKFILKNKNKINLDIYLNKIIILKNYLNNIMDNYGDSKKFYNLLEIIKLVNSNNIYNIYIRKNNN